MSEVVPDVLDALYAKFRTFGVQTVLGPPNEWIEPELIAIGISTEDVDPVEQGSRRAGLGSKRAHSFEIINLVHVHSGDGDMSAATHRAFQIVGLCRTAIENDHTLARVVMRAEISGTRYLPRRENGVVALVEFRVRIDTHR